MSNCDRYILCLSANASEFVPTTQGSLSTDRLKNKATECSCSHPTLMLLRIIEVKLIKETAGVIILYFHLHCC